MFLVTSEQKVSILDSRYLHWSVFTSWTWFVFYYWNISPLLQKAFSVLNWDETSLIIKDETMCVFLFLILFYPLLQWSKSGWMRIFTDISQYYTTSSMFHRRHWVFQIKKLLIFQTTALMYLAGFRLSSLKKNFLTLQVQELS